MDQSASSFNSDFGGRALATKDGVELHIDTYLATERQAHAVLLHGFGQTAQAWARTGRALADAGIIAWAPDMRGHGHSDWAKNGYALATFVEDLNLIASNMARPRIAIGASMGGLLALLLAGQERSPFDALILVDITPRWEVSGVERILRFMRAHPEGFASIVEAQAAVADYLPHRGEAKSSSLSRNLVRGQDGRLRWHWDPALLDNVGADPDRYHSQLVDAAKRVTVPTLLVSGSHSDVVSGDTITEFMGLIPHAEHLGIDQATHMVVGDDNHRFTHAVADFLQRHRFLPSSARSLNHG